MRFSKMHGAGNDFVVINTIEEDVSLSSASCLARTVQPQDRHRRRRAYARCSG